MDTLFHDLRFAARTLLENRGFTAAAVIVLALGIGANSAVFSVVGSVLLRPLPYPEPDRLVALSELSERGVPIRVSYPNFRDWREQARSFDALAAHQGGMVAVRGGTEPRLAGVRLVTGDFFSVLGVDPRLGRTFSEASARAGEPPGAVVGDRFWRDALGGRPDALGRPLTVFGRSFDVVGVMPPGFAFPADAEVWLPKDAFEDTSDRSAHNLEVVGRLAAGTPPAAAREEMTVLQRRLEALHGERTTGAVALVSLEDSLVGEIRPRLLVLFGAVVFVLLIACANVANLILIRTANRGQELAVRAALGATRGRITRQILTETVLLALLGAAVGLVLAVAGVRLIVALAPGDLPRLDEVAIDPWVLLFTLAVAVVSGLLVGLAPAIRMSSPRLREALHEGGRGGAALQRNRWRAALMVAEVAMTLVLLVGAGLLLRSFVHVLGADSGIDPERVLTASISLPDENYERDHQVVDFYRRLIDRVGSLPGVAAAGMVNNLPLSGRENYGTFYLEERPGEEGGAGYRVVSADYFRALGIPLLQGRGFEPQDGADQPHRALVNRALADRYWPGESALGRRIRVIGMDSHDGTWLEIVGVVGDVRHASLESEARPEIYVHVGQRVDRAFHGFLVVRTDSEPGALADGVRRAIAQADPAVPSNVEPMATVIRRSYGDRRFNVLLLSLFAAVALTLATVGIYGVIAYSVTRRTGEIGIRMALGARRRDVSRLIVQQGLWVLAAGLAAGLLVAVPISSVLASQLYQVRTYDPAVFVGVSLLLLATTLLACYLPARRAARIEPTRALRAR